MSNNLRFGSIVGMATYTKVCRPEHFMVKYQGFGISEEELDLLDRRGVKLVLINYVGKDGVRGYLSLVRQWTKSDKRHNDTSRGADDHQRFLSIKEMWELPK